MLVTEIYSKYFLIYKIDLDLIIVYNHNISILNLIFIIRQSLVYFLLKYCLQSFISTSCDIFLTYFLN